MIIARFSYYIHAVSVWLCPDPSHKARTRNGTRNRTMQIVSETHARQPVATYDARKTPGGRGLLVNCVPMHEQRTAKLILNSVFSILNLIHLFTWSCQKSKPFQCSQSLTSAAFECCTNNTYIQENYCNSISLAAQLRPGLEHQVLFPPRIHKL